MYDGIVRVMRSVREEVAVYTELERTGVKEERVRVLGV